MVPKLGNREHAGSTAKPEEALNDPVFIERLLESLSDSQVEYVRSLLKNISERVKDNSQFRTMLAQKVTNAEQFNDYDPKDIWILKRIFL